MKTPIVKSLDPNDLKRVLTFMALLQNKGNVFAARVEARRLAPYWGAYAEALAEDLKQATPATEKPQEPPTKGKLSRLFNAVARKSGNTILSEMMIVPDSALTNDAILEGTTQFVKTSYYNGHNFSLGFIQVFAKDNSNSTSLPVLGFDRNMMSAIAPFHPKRLLAAFQQIITAGNHDMQHHFSNSILNGDVARIRNEDREGAINDWSEKYFRYMGDKDSGGYENWLLLNHARMRHLLEQRPEGEKLKNNVDIFFDELARIGRERSVTQPSNAHEAVDYFGTMALFSLMRVLPLDHPLFEHALTRLEQTAIDPQRILDMRSDILHSALNEENMPSALNNYRKKGCRFDLKEPDYRSLKRMQVMLMEPWMARLLSPAQDGTELHEHQTRVGRINHHMIQAAIQDTHFEMVDGVSHFKGADGSTIEKHLQNGVYHRDDGPAYIKIERDGGRTEAFYAHGKKTYEMKTSDSEGREESWFKDGKRHREDGPAYIKTEPDGDYTEAWYKDGEAHREGGYAFFYTTRAGYRHERWCKNGKLHREEGPAVLFIFVNGTREERWYKEDREVPAPASQPSSPKPPHP